MGEECKVAIRSIRRDAMEKFKAMQAVLPLRALWIIWSKTELTTASFSSLYTNICRTAQAARQATGKKLNQGGVAWSAPPLGHKIYLLHRYLYLSAKRGLQGKQNRL